MFLKFARLIASILGHPKTFASAILLIIVWLATGPMFHYDDTWQLYINTFTTIITFLVVIVLQHSSNHDAEMLDSKLNEIIALLNKENLSIEELKVLEEHHEELIINAIKEAKEENEEENLEKLDIAD